MSSGLAYTMTTTNASISEQVKPEAIEPKPEATNKLGSFQDWSQIDCSICSDPIRQLCTESPLDLNEHLNLNIIVLPCKHYYHFSCINEWLKHESVCPYCRAPSKAQSLNKMVCPPVRCRASILRKGKGKVVDKDKDKSKNRLGEQCECLEYPNNMGFCRKHLPPLNELKVDDSYVINLGNRKFLTILKYQHLNSFPPDIKKELLIKAHNIVKDSGEGKTHEQLLKEIMPHMTLN